MAKTTAPLLSFDAGGAIAKTQVYSRWRGIPYVRRYVIPANPQTVAQTLTRDLFRTFGQMWQFLPGDARAPWTAFATGRQFTDRNAFQGQNVKAVRASPSDFEFFVGSPGALGGLPPADITPTPAGTSIAFAVDVPTPPDGWTLTKAAGILFPDGDPTAPWSTPIQYVEDTTSTYELDFTGLTASTAYVASIWLQWEKPNGYAAYSVGTTLQESTT